MTDILGSIAPCSGSLDTWAAGLDTFVLAGAFNDIWVYTLRTLFFLSAILLMVIVLLQEGKGGGLAAALGGQGADTFGVATGGVNKVTMTLAGVFLLAALFHAVSFNQDASAALRRDREKAGRTLPGDGVDDESDLPPDDGGEETDPPRDATPPGDTTPPKDESPPGDETPPKDGTTGDGEK